MLFSIFIIRKYFYFYIIKWPRFQIFKSTQRKTVEEHHVDF